MTTIDSLQLASVTGGQNATNDFNWTGTRKQTGPAAPQRTLPEIWGEQAKKNATGG